MVAASNAYVVGWYLFPALVGLAAAIWYTKRGWPRTDDPGWRTWVRTGIGVVVGLYIFGQVAVIATSGQSSTPPIQSVTPMDKWTTKVFMPEALMIASNIKALETAEVHHSWVGINNACFSGVAAADVSVGKPPAPNARIQSQYHRWLVDVFDMFTYCQRASATETHWHSSAGAANWAVAMHYSLASDQAYLGLDALSKNLNK